MKRLPWLLLVALVLAGCASDPHAAHRDHWTFTERAGEEPPADMGAVAGFGAALELRANASMRQVGGQWRGALEAERPLTLRFDASVPVLVAFQVRSDTGAASSGTCDWPEDSTEERAVGLGRARMRSTETTCEIVFTPHVRIDGSEPTLRWEARSAQAHADGWTLQFQAEA